MKTFCRIMVPIVVGLIFSGCLPNDRAGQTTLSKNNRPSACTLLDVTEQVFGPAKFSRSTGKPQVETAGFEVQEKGEICVLVVNGASDPPHGKRISSAWISIDGELVIGPEEFSQVVDAVTAPRAIEAGPHELSVRLASKPGSFITVEVRFLPEDTEPPLISIEPGPSELIETDMPLVGISYHDEGVGVDLSTLTILLNGENVSGLFSIGQTEANWQIPCERYLDEGANAISVSLADRLGNGAVADSEFIVATPTPVLLGDLESADSCLRRRSAYKLLYREEVLTIDLLHKCLNQLNATPEPRATDRLLQMLELAWVDHHSRVLDAGAIGEAAAVSPETAARDDVVDALGRLLLLDRSFAVKVVAARALGLTKNSRALDYLVEYLEGGGPISPPRPAEELYEEYLQYQKLSDGVGLQAVRAIIRIAGHGYQVGNPGDLEVLRHKLVESLSEIFSAASGQGGAP
ncbi:MAG TPA: hypothetical protein VM425_19375 [Myxococcota bacterium]|nr:hypothetical protein [Myxococcota bacterium]